MESISKRLNEMFDAEQKQIHNEFEKTLKSLDPIFQKNGWIRPRDWTEVSNWYNLNFKDESSYQKPKIEDREIYIRWAESNHINQEIEKPEKVEAYTNLPHALCILDDLGILDLIEEKFSDKHYKGKARETDKAKLIATILGIEDAQKIRHPLKNKDYLSDKAKQNAVKTLKTLGLDPSKFTDYSF
jgi:hypothetical protein